MRLVLFLACVAVSRAATPIEITNSWNGGFQGKFHVQPDHAVHGWTAHLVFDRDVQKIEIWRGVVSSHTPREWLISNMDWDADLNPGDDLVVDFVARSTGDQPGSGSYFIEGLGNGNPAPATTPGSNTDNNGGNTQAPSTGHQGGSSTKYNYGEALKLSILFYYAQRSGRLPSDDNPISWRGDSAVGDSADGHDLSGGWYDAGDHVKFNLPMAYSSWVLNWGLIKFKDGYQNAGQVDQACKCLKWPLDYFLKCWIPDQQTLYVQVGDGYQDHGFWGRPENMHMGRPAYKVNAGCPGADVAADTAAALASGAIMFKDVCNNAGYADKLLTAAKSLYNFAKNHRGTYTNCVTQAKDFYGSSNDQDELAVAASWLHKATGDAGYLSDAKSFHSAGVPWALSWDDTNIAADLLLYDITKDNAYKGDITGFVNSYMPGGSVPQTPCGLAYRDKWGANRYAGNAAFVAVMAAAEGINADQYKKWAMTQINYLLGDNKYHMSYEIGFGNHYPTHPHHRGSSCPTNTNWCDANSGGPNPNLLKGALVGGPDQGDNYQDSRSDYVKNEVACDYNAAFQGALAGLVHFAANNDLPPSPNSKC